MIKSRDDQEENELEVRPLPTKPEKEKETTVVKKGRRAEVCHCRRQIAFLLHF